MEKCRLPQRNAMDIDYSLLERFETSRRRYEAARLALPEHWRTDPRPGSPGHQRALGERDGASLRRSRQTHRRSRLEEHPATTTAQAPVTDGGGALTVNPSSVWSIRATFAGEAPGPTPMKM